MGSVLQKVGREAADRKQPDELEAYDLVLRAIATPFYVRDDYQRKKALLDQAIKRDPSYARPRHEYAWLMLMGFIFRFEEVPLPPKPIKQNAIRSVELDPADPLAHRTAAYGYFFDHQLDLFENEANMALDLAPYNAEVVAQLGMALTFIGQWDRGLGLVRKANSLNAAAAAGWYHTAVFYDYHRKGEYQKALHIVRQHPVQGICETIHKYVSTYGHLGEPEQAREYWSKCVAIEPSFTPERVLGLFDLWNQPRSLSMPYMQGFAKAGIPCRTPSCEINQ